jgi:NADH-quinone oxidoreductase subunit L
VEGRRPGLIDGAADQRLGAHGGRHRRLVRLVQTGHLYWYALVMVLGIFGFSPGAVALPGRG